MGPYKIVSIKFLGIQKKKTLSNQSTMLTWLSPVSSLLKRRCLDHLLQMEVLRLLPDVIK